MSERSSILWVAARGEVSTQRCACKVPRANPSARWVPTPRPASSVYDAQTDGRHGYALTTPKFGWHQSVCVAQVGKVGAGQEVWPPQPGGPPSWFPRGARFRPKGAPPKSREPTPRRKVRPQSAESQPLGERAPPKCREPTPRRKGAPKVSRANPSAKGTPPMCREPTPRRKVRPQCAGSQPLGERCAPNVPRANPSAKGAPPKCREPTPRRRSAPKVPRTNPSAKGRVGKRRLVQPGKEFQGGCTSC